MICKGAWFQIGAVLLAGVLLNGCLTTRNEKRTQTIKVNTNPPGAQLWVEDKSGQRVIGESPSNLELEYNIVEEDFNKWSWAAPAITGLVSGIGIVWANVDGQADPAYYLGYGGAVALLGSLIYCIVGQLRQEHEIKINKLTIGADLDGYSFKNIHLQIPNDEIKEVNLLPAKTATSTTLASSSPRNSGPGKLIVAVFDIQDTTGKIDKKDLVNLTSYLGTVLAQTGKYKIVPRDQLRARLFEQTKGTHKDCYEESCQIELGRALAAQKTLATTLIRVGGKCAVTANLFDLKTVTAEKGASVDTGCSTSELLAAMKKIAAQF